MGGSTSSSTVAVELMSHGSCMRRSGLAVLRSVLNARSVGLVVFATVILYAVGVERGRSLFAATRALVAWSDRSPYVHFTNMVGVGLFALFLYALKRRGRVRYGALEITFAAAVIWYALGDTTAPPEAVFAELLGACYVFVRGLENVEQGRRAQREASTPTGRSP